VSEKEAAQTAIYIAITAAIENLEPYNPMQRATALESLALAYRYVSGGQQPGASVVAK
jgi:hypothetical protein